MTLEEFAPVKLRHERLCLTAEQWAQRLGLPLALMRDRFKRGCMVRDILAPARRSAQAWDTPEKLAAFQTQRHQRRSNERV